jgi:hypothetical protein
MPMGKTLLQSSGQILSLFYTAVIVQTHLPRANA